MDLYCPLEEIRWEGFTTMKYLAPEEAAKGEFRPVTEGMQWGHTWEYLWLRAHVTLPREARGKRIVMDLALGGEATLFVNGKAFGTRRAEWVSHPHHFLVDNVLAECAEGGETFELLLEVYAGHFVPGMASSATGPVLPGMLEDPAEEGKRRTLGRCSYGVWNEDAYQLLMDVQTLREVMEALPETSLRAADLADGLEAFTERVDFEQPPEMRCADYRAARELLAPLLDAKNGDTAPVFYAIGNSHLDLAWLWPMQETMRKTARTFAQQLRLLQQYPEYKYLQSQPASYQMCKDHYPELYARIKEAIRGGQWIADGAMYVEPDTNMPSGEALVRQLVIGKRFFREELGVESRLLWLPDTFGYSAALPQILKGCGVDYLVTQKIFWSYNDSDVFPYHYFTWRGLDGGEITAFLPTSYTYDTRPAEVLDAWDKRRQKRHLDAFLYPFGYGDGGGGPARDHIEYALREKDLEGMPRMRMDSPVAFFERMAARYGKPADTWSGELYFSCHRGTYTAQSAIKRNNRLSENALHEAETWAAAASVLRHAAYPQSALTALWKTLLLNQFHDILPGSSIARVYEEANAQHAQLQKEASALAAQARGQLLSGEGVTVFNSLGFAREVLVPLPEGWETATACGEPVPVLDGVAVAKVPPLGTVTLHKGGAPVPMTPATAALTSGGAVLENAALRVTLNALGEITSLVMKDTGREFVSGRMNVLRLYKDIPRKYDAWDLDSNYAKQPVALEAEAEMTLVCAQGATAAVRVVRRVGTSVLTQDITLDAHSRRVAFVSELDWHEQHRLLKVDFTGTPVALEAEHEIQFGAIRRPTHRSRQGDRDRFEVCNHRYTALHDASHGFAVLNDCKYGVSAEDQTISLSLMRASKAPDVHADQGRHRFTYAVYCWEGSYLDSGVALQGLDLNRPATVCAGGCAPVSLACTSAANVLIDTVKLAEDGSGDLVLRLYESMGADTAFTLSLGVDAAAVSRVNMLEEESEPAELTEGRVQLHARPYEIVTLRVRLA